MTQVVPTPDFTQFIDADGMFRANERAEQGATAMLDELYTVAVALKTMRQAA